MWNSKVFSKEVGVLVLRIVLPLLMFVHGYSKLELLINDAPILFPDPLGIGKVTSLFMAMIVEIGCSFLVLIGFKTRYATIPLIFTMLVAMFVVHLHDPWAQKELAILYLVGFVVLFFSDSGYYSVDQCILNMQDED